jgi:hypothetical protein
MHQQTRSNDELQFNTDDEDNGDQGDGAMDQKEG